MSTKKLLLTVFLALIPALVSGQSSTQGGLDPASLLKPLSDTWPTYSGDYTGRRYSALKQADRNTVKNLTLGWVARVTGGNSGGRVILGGEGTGEFAGAQVKGASL